MTIFNNDKVMLTLTPLEAIVMNFVKTPKGDYEWWRTTHGELKWVSSPQ